MSVLTIPASLTEEHEEIFSELKKFAKTNGETGLAIRELLGVLEPHFEKEDELAMPLLGLLPKLAMGEKLGYVAEVVALHEKFGREYRRMFHEHEAIREKISEATKAAKRERRPKVCDLLDRLAHHAKVEEEVLYPAALLVGMVITATPGEISV